MGEELERRRSRGGSMMSGLYSGSGQGGDSYDIHSGPYAGRINVDVLHRPRRQRPTRLFVLAALATASLLGLFLFLLLRPPPHDSKARLEAKGLPQKFINAPSECNAGPAVPQDRRKDKGRLRLVNFNAEWLFLYGGTGSIRCPSDACPWADMTEALDHLQQVADMLTSLDADIVHLSEVEDCRVLQVLLQLLPDGHGYLPYLVRGRDTVTGQNTALLTRIDPVENVVRTMKRLQYPVGDSRCPSNQPGTTGITKHHVALMDVETGVGGEKIPLLLAGLHLLSRPFDKRRCAQREGQAAVLRDMIRSMSKEQDRMVIVMGDFNDYDEEALGPDGKHPITNVLPILYQSSGTDRKIINVASLVPKADRYSCWFDANQNCRIDGDRERVMIDHILFDSRLGEAVVEVRIPHDKMPTCEQRISDHWPVLVTFNLTKVAKG